MSENEDDPADKAFVKITNGTVYRLNDDRPDSSEFEQKEDEEHLEYINRRKSESRGDHFEEVYLYPNGWVQCVTVTDSHSSDREYDRFPSWYPPQQIEKVF